MEQKTSGYKGVMRLAHENPKWIPIVEAALKTAQSVKADFAGSWVLEKTKEKGLNWFPNLRILVTHGILNKEGISRAGRRAYYSMPDIEGVHAALAELKNE
ncbi:MAG: hypothetical protein A3B11_00880 [Candidatus Taylorbacteria bacterium RIFCSPLOWO2_01_FULL_44_26]|uniref:Uncharacterized protein n=2 Tax=Parcubacteria group TaxID=1794811 RepID=A0A1G2N7Y4_9BACT|nr:MAG: hypothetical protein A2647_01275 [Candidatus Nomurabacteria bacterium RIFCSPHIGHO2_01_FULL_40_24b]OHA31499.1 MAG: hypothetical protein A3B11_00880 [Candidatus Taylorbacteria bacterium RIFCSPLOWO2_01_FULL_44_26]